ncbi:MAG TPA: SDR family NAD(P)-dependent oxidoreductase, partial [Polyangiaceae bacterium]|nr:SDR family NAD(P)-dependent oxidoreductase [Polyangiaceae bacterium]
MTTKIHSGSGLLSGKIAVIYGGGGAIGGAAALAFAEEGARVFLAGRTLARLDEVAERVRAVGGEVEVDVVDALDQATVEAHAERVAGRAGRIDVVLNALG